MLGSSKSFSSVSESSRSGSSSSSSSASSSNHCYQAFVSTYDCASATWSTPTASGSPTCGDGNVLNPGVWVEVAGSPCSYQTYVAASPAADCVTDGPCDGLSYPTPAAPAFVPSGCCGSSSISSSGSSGSGSATRTCDPAVLAACSATYTVTISGYDDPTIGVSGVDGTHTVTYDPLNNYWFGWSGAPNMSYSIILRCVDAFHETPGELPQGWEVQVFLGGGGMTCFTYYRSDATTCPVTGVYPPLGCAGDPATVGSRASAVITVS